MPQSKTLSRSDFSWIHRISKHLLLRKLTAIHSGRLTIRDETDGTENVFGISKPTPTDLDAVVRIQKPRAYTQMLLGGSVGVGESYIDEDWECDNLSILTRLFVRNRESLNALDSGFGALIQPMQKFWHSRKANKKFQATRNIQAHYDLGNSFFELFLDKTWGYSAGHFQSKDTTLEEAQTEKFERICRKLKLKSSDHIIEIGTGWGGFAVHAATRYGCKVTTTTISPKQYEHAVAWVKKQGLSDKITVLQKDYRDIAGKFDHLVSIEMIEAVGLDFLDTYFKQCSDLVQDDGSILIQSILMRESWFKQAAQSVDFIQSHVFPGSAIPSMRRIAQSVERTDLMFEDADFFGEHYAKTLSIWSENLRHNRERFIQLGYPNSLYRLWQFYFAYCEGGFAEKSISVAQILFTKLKHRHGEIYG